MHLWGQVRKVHAYRGQVLSGIFVDHSFCEPRSRFPGACGGRDLRDLACLPACQPL